MINEITTLILISAAACGYGYQAEPKNAAGLSAQAKVSDPMRARLDLPSQDSDARRKLQSAAEAEDARAQYELALLFEWGEPQDFKLFQYWLRRSAERGYAPAQFALGIGLGLGSGAVGSLPHSETEGLKWLLLASKQENKDQDKASAAIAFLRRRMSQDEIDKAERQAREFRPPQQK